MQTVPSQAALPTAQRCVNEQGFSLHAEVRCAIHQRHKLEHLCRYITRPASVNERLTLNRAGHVVLALKTPYRDSATHIVMSPLRFMQRLAALVPPSAAPSHSLPWRARTQRQTASPDRTRTSLQDILRMLIGAARARASISDGRVRHQESR